VVVDVLVIHLVSTANCHTKYVINQELVSHPCLGSSEQIDDFNKLVQRILFSTGESNPVSPRPRTAARKSISFIMFVSVLPLLIMRVSMEMQYCSNACELVLD
jgi:hypothetical protein